MRRITKDGRIIRTGSDYTKLRQLIWKEQNHLCARCMRFVGFYDFELHHKNGRGMGGSKRNDIPEEVAGLCIHCHRNEHGQ